YSKMPQPAAFAKATAENAQRSFESVPRYKSRVLKGVALAEIETHSLPTLTHVLPPISTFRFAHLCHGFPARSVRSIREQNEPVSGPLLHYGV
ncbi:MAG TPA: hypothetical protein VE133_09425, partial [Candidatus Sulfotelmatobacter sp.]|nr:hypothetical protein [Candidatus Sulfotelmatobacter sp.]